MKQLVRVWKRPTHDGQTYTYYLVYYDNDGRRKQKALGHADKRKAKKQCVQLARELRMDTVEPYSMRMSEFLEDSLARTRGQVRENTALEYDSTMRHFIDVIGDIDYCHVRHEHGERFIQACLDGGNRPATVAKKIGTLKRLFQLAVEREQLEDNPFRHIRKPKSSRRDVHTFSDEECTRMVEAARQLQIGGTFRWDIFILTALCTGMRRGELLNTTWQDIDIAGLRRWTAYDVTNVQMQLVDATDAVISVTDDSVIFDIIEAGQIATNTVDTFSLVVDRSQLIEPGHLTWELIYYEAGGQQVNQSITMSLSADDLDLTDVPGDITGEGVVDIQDLAVLASQRLQQPGIPSADIAPDPKDNFVNLLDFVVLAKHWLED